MGRLAEYFCVIGVKDKTNLYDGKVLEGCVIQKFPENEWKSSPCPPSLELFCQPAGWYCSKEQSPPTFYVAILTDVEGKGSYLACLNFHEAIQQEVVAPQTNNGGVASLQDDGIGVDECTGTEKTYETFHVPMCLCIVSREKHYKTLKDCLTTLFYAHLNGQKELVENIIGTMLGLIYVPPPGGSFLKFSLGGGDEQVVQPPLSADLPCTNDSVAVLFNLLGIYTILKVFTALVTESKIMLLSSSYTHLSMASQALVSLLYPMKFNYVFIPILPASLLDFLLAPTPFLMGVHTEYQHKMPDLFDVVVVNIDEGCVTVPECIRLVPMPEPYYSCVLKSLKMILNPSLFSSDMLIRPDEKPPAPISQDKELRAVFIKLFADMFCGYRACLTLIRVYPRPVITFNKMSFIEKRGFVNDDFFNKVCT
jgi:myotubularin-related protein 5/13